MLKDLKHYFPQLVKSKLDLKGEQFYIDDLSEVKKLLESPSALPQFAVTGKKGSKESMTKEYTFLRMTKVAELGDGKSFGELALLTNAKRNATIRAVTETHFAVILQLKGIFYTIDYE